MRNTTEGRVILQKAKERIDTEMAEKLKKLTDKAQEERRGGRREGSALKRPRKDLPCEIGTGSSSSSSTAPAAATMDTSVDVSYKRAAPAGESDERDTKKQKPGDESEHMEVSHVERMMQEDYVCSVNDVSDMCEETSDDVQGAVTDMNFYDETTGELFNQRLVREVEDEELQRFKKMGVCDYVDRQTAHQDGEGIFVKDRWVRVNKGTKTNPHMKCRLVAQELVYGTRMDELYANTPSLSCIKLAMLYAAQKGKGRKLMTLDVKGAFLYGAALRKIHMSYPVRTLSMGVTRSGFSAKRCTARVMLLRSGNLKSEGRWNILVSDGARCSRPCISTTQKRFCW